MGGTRLRFPLPHRKPRKQPSIEIQTISSPLTNKAQKFLGTTEISADCASPASAIDHPKVWDAHSAISGLSSISVTVSETTVAAPVPGAAESTVTPGSRSQSRADWDQESDIIPKGLGLDTASAARSRNLDLTTDASSLRRRRSSSTIMSYYDKTKLPLSISQQTSSSAMAKGLPDMRDGPLDMECPRPAPPPPTMHKRKPSRLDFSHLLPSSASSRLSRLSLRGKEGVNMVLGSDLFTRSPSALSTSSPVPVISPAESEAKPGFLRRKLTKESLRGTSRPRWSSFSSEPPNIDPKMPLRQRATDTGNLNQLYEHYEQTSVRDTADHSGPDVAMSRKPSDSGFNAGWRPPSRKGSQQSLTISSPSMSKPRHQHSPSFGSISWRPSPAYSPDETCGPIAENVRMSTASSNLASPRVDCSGSVSSRHSRTSRASKTGESFAEFDPNYTSVLSLSSDSEDDDPEPPTTAASKSGVGSRDNVPNPKDHRRKPSNTSSVSVEPPRSQSQLKSRFRNSMGSQAPFLAIPEDEDTKDRSSPKINPRTSSLSSAIDSNSPRPSISTMGSSVRSQSRLSQVSMSTADSIPPHFSRPRPSATASSTKPAPEIQHIAMQSRAMTPTPTQRENVPEKQHKRSLSRLTASPKRSHQTPPMSPSSMEFVIRGQQDSTPDHKGPVLMLSGDDHASEERFISVTPQEEMLLSAMRAKRALMRENSQSGDAKASARSKPAVRKEPLSSTKAVKRTGVEQSPHTRTLHARKSSKKLATALQFPEPPSTKTNPTQATSIREEILEEEDILTCLDRAVDSMESYEDAEQKSGARDFIIDFDAKQFPAPPRTSHSRNSSTASAAGRLTHSRRTGHKRQSSFGRPRPDSDFLPKLLPSSEALPPMPQHGRRAGDLDAMSGKIKQAPVDTPESSSSATFSDQEVSKSSSRKKAVRISAVGLTLPEVGQWGDDG